VSVNGLLVEDKMCTFTLESTHFIFNKCLIYTHDGASAKFITNSQEKNYSEAVEEIYYTGTWVHSQAVDKNGLAGKIQGPPMREED
jgi:hypothetical protein